MPTIRLLSNDMVHTPGVLRWILSTDSKALEAKSAECAARLYLIAVAFPDLPCGIAVKLAWGDLNHTVEGDTVIISYEDGEE
jgi:hypothetical protein